MYISRLMYTRDGLYMYKCTCICITTYTYFHTYINIFIVIGMRNTIYSVTSHLHTSRDITNTMFVVCKIPHAMQFSHCPSPPSRQLVSMAAAIPALKLHVSTMGSYGVVLFQRSKHSLLATGNVLAAGVVAVALAFFLRASHTPSTCPSVCSICKNIPRYPGRKCF